MITYELAKQLKDAGFSQYGRGTEYFASVQNKPNPINIVNKTSTRLNHHMDVSMTIQNDDIVYVPLLSELIDAVSIKLFSQFSLEMHSNDWRAGIYRESREFPKQFQSGYTPEEAVARLWLVINKK